MTEQKERKKTYTGALPRRGLTPEQVTVSRQKSGDNTLSPKKHKSFAGQFLSNMGDPVIRILLCALAINILFMFRRCDWFETAGIAVSVFLATFISTLSEYGSEAAFRKLSEESERTYVRVKRDGEIVSLPSGEIVVGDIVLLGAGENIPADGIILEGHLTTDQSAMTGESREIYKIPGAEEPMRPESPRWLFRGCAILTGEGEMLVTAVGDSTFLGEISREIQEDPRPSPLKLRLAHLAAQISRLGYCAAFLVSLADLFQAFVLGSGGNAAVIFSRLCNLPYLFDQLFHALTLGLTVIVVAVPEGLPMMIAVVLSSNIRRMVKDQVLVRKPVGIEAAGSMNILFTDKTGTITQGKLSVGELFLAGEEICPGVGALKSHDPVLFSLYCAAVGTGSAAVLSDGKVGGGNATDRALLESILPHRPPTPPEIAWRLAFDSARKFSAAGVRGGTVYVKGAPEVLLPHITHAIDASGSRIPFSRFHFEKTLAERTQDGSRVLLVAMGDCTPDGRLGELTFLCGLTLRDKLRREAPDAVKKLQNAGIHVVMITGDNRETATAIAASCGILTKEVNITLTGEELGHLSDEKLRRMLPHIGVIARALPTDKSRLVRIAQEAELVVGMTGDGINDAPALKRADIGFAMGAGTQVAKEAGDIIILDNNLASIVKAVLYGRNIFKSIRKFISLQLTMNFCAVGVSMICPFLGIDAPVTVVQMLWINIIMDTLGGLAFAGEPALPSCMNEPPKRRSEPILNRYMIHEIFFLGVMTIGLCLAFLKCPAITSRFRPAEDNIYLLTAFFALFIFSSVFNCFNTRTDRLNLFAGIGGNPAFLLIMTIISIVQIVFVYLGGAVLRTAPLTPGELLLTMLLSLCVFPAEWLRKLIWRARHGKTGY